MFDLNEEEIKRLAVIYKLLGSESRLKILFFLGKNEHIASDIAKFCNLSLPAASHQLKDLKNLKIIESRKEGLNVYYSLYDNHIIDLLMCGIDHIRGKHCLK